MLSIRLSRGGSKKRPYYRIVVAEKSRSRDGRFVELLGHSNPVALGKEIPVQFNTERYQYWCGQGAQPTLTVKRLFRLYQNNLSASDNHANQPAS